MPHGGEPAPRARHVQWSGEEPLNAMHARTQTADEAAAAQIAARQAEVAAALAAVLPSSVILTRREQTAPYECDGLTAFRATPMLVVLPEDERQLAAMLK